MATGFVNRVIFNASSTGTGSFVVASAVTGYLTPAQASATDQKSYRYAAQIVDGSGNITDWEIGTGTYTVSSTTLTRTVLKSSNSDSAVAFSTVPQVMLTAFAGDLTLLYSTAQVDKGTATATVTFDVSASSKQKLDGWRGLYRCFYRLAN